MPRPAPSNRRGRKRERRRGQKFSAGAVRILTLGFCTLEILSLITFHAVLSLGLALENYKIFLALSPIPFQLFVCESLSSFRSLPSLLNQRFSPKLVALK